jgi:hypothetical protein
MVGRTYIMAIIMTEKTARARHERLFNDPVLSINQKWYYQNEVNTPQQWFRRSVFETLPCLP